MYQNEVRSNLEYYERLKVGTENRIIDLQQQLKDENSVLDYLQQMIDRLRSHPEEIINFE